MKYAREQNILFRNLFGHANSGNRNSTNITMLEGANSTEFDPKTPHPVIGMITEWQDPDGKQQKRSGEDDLGGTMRLEPNPANYCLIVLHLKHIRRG